MASNKDNPSLLGGKLSVINVGLDKFATELTEHDVPVVHLDWRPPAGGDPELAALLSKMGT
jgi:hypothetical protein